MTLKEFETLIAPLDPSAVNALFDSVSLQRLTLANQQKGIEAKINSIREQAGKQASETQTLIEELTAMLNDIQKQIDALE